MSNGRRWAIIGFAIVVVVGAVIGVVYAFSSDSSKDQVAPPGTLDVGAVAPNFTLPVVGGNGSGTVSLASYRGRPVIVAFGASYCGPCHQEFPLLAKAAAQHPNVAVVGVDPEDLPNQMQSMMRSTGAKWPAGDDAKGTVSARYGVSSLPVTFFVAPNGKIVARGFGLTSKDRLQEPLQTLLDTSM